jgi:hypothetical protein
VFKTPQPPERQLRAQHIRQEQRCDYYQNSSHNKWKVIRSLRNNPFSEGHDFSSPNIGVLRLGNESSRDAI